VRSAKRIRLRFEEIRRRRGAGLIPFLTAGDPSLAFTERALGLLDRPGIAAIEIGVPFSDPLADGPTIQRSSERALAGGITLAETLELVRRVRKSISAPLVLMSYMNPIFRFGLDRFADRASRAGVDAVLATDLPVEESTAYRRVLREHGIGTVFLAAPTSPPDRVSRIAKACSAFLYYVSLTGVTGARRTLDPDLAARLGATRALTKLPLAVGFGVSSAEQVAALAPHCDAVVVGSTLVEAIETERSDRARLSALDRKVAALLQPLLGEGKR
jgi:tryptophan synthase alpha chain